MTQEDKELLIKDLCTRLPYGVRCSFGVDDAIYEVCGVNPTCCGASEIQATKEQRDILFQKMKEAGYKWNEETKTLEKLIEPKFKVGDKIRHKTHIRQGNVVTEIKDTHYILDDELALSFISQDDYELVPNKFDITTLKPFAEVLVRGNVGQKWTHDFFGFMDKDKGCPFVCVGHYVIQCVPYENNEHLLGKTDDCDDYFKTWE